MNRIRYSLLLAALLGAAAPLSAQEPAPPAGADMIDRVVAVVGDSAILQSDLAAEIAARAQARGIDVRRIDPATAERLQREVLDQKIEEMLLLQAALADTTITVSDAEIDPMVNREVAQRERAAGGPARLDAALRQAGMTRQEYRAMLAAGMRRTSLIQAYLAKVQRDRKPPTVSEQEIREFFEANRAGLAERPATITFRQVVISPEPSAQARQAARERAEAVLEQVQEGEDFVTLAKRHTEEPGGRERGGELGWFRRGQMVPEFENVAFGMRPGQTSGIVETQFGFHIIKVEKVKGAEIQARHILFIPEKGDADVARAEALADSVAAMVRAGAAMDSLVEKYGDTEEQERVGPYPKDQLPPEYARALASAETGDVVGPFALSDAGDGRKFAVVRVTEVKEQGEYSLDDPEVHAQVRTQVAQNKLIEEIIGELRRRSHVDVRI